MGKQIHLTRSFSAEKSFMLYILKLKRKIRFSIFAFLILFQISITIQAQSSGINIVTHDSTIPNRQVAPKDMIDVTKKLLRLRHPIITDSIKVDSNKIFFAFLPAVGYALQTGVTAILATNISFFASKKEKNNKLSSFTINPAYSLRNQVMVPIQSNIWLNNNRINLIGDWRYYKYPSNTYGLGGHTSLANADLIDYSYVRFYQEASKQIFPNFYIGMGYGLDWHFGIAEKGSGINFQGYNDNKKQTLSSGPVLNLTYDSRNNTNNPQTGNYANLTVHNNLIEFGSNNNWQSVQVDLRKFVKLTTNGKHILAFWSYNWFTFGGNVPYFDLPSTGWDTYSNTGRGYIQGRLRGTNMLYLETEYRFTLTRNGLFGGVVFANAQSVSDYPSNKFQTILPATGMGIRIKLNKVSRVNFALDYAVGVGGSRGFFFNLSEVF